MNNQDYCLARARLSDLVPPTAQPSPGRDATTTRSDGLAQAPLTRHAYAIGRAFLGHELTYVSSLPASQHTVGYSISRVRHTRMLWPSAIDHPLFRSG